MMARRYSFRPSGNGSEILQACAAARLDTKVKERAAYLVQLKEPFMENV